MPTIVRVVLSAVFAVAVCSTGCQSKRKAEADPTESPTVAKGSGVPGVEAERITICQTGAFSGANAQQGIESWRGAASYLFEVNATGGVHGRKIEVIALDDGYDSPRAATNAEQFAREGKCFILFNANGSGMTAAIVDVLTKFKTDDLMLWANSSGAQKQREPPGSDQVFNVRASLRQMMRGFIDSAVAGGKKKIGAFMQDDEFGNGVVDGAKKALAGHNLELVAVTKHPRNQKYEVSTTEQVKALRAAGAEVVILATNYQPASAFVRDARAEKWNVRVGISGGHDTLLRTLVAEEKKTHVKLTDGILAGQFVPAIDSDLPAVREYRELMEKRNPRPPAELTDPNYRVNAIGVQSLEGFLNAKILVEVLRRTGPEPTRAKFRAAAEALKGWDPGVGANVDFAADDHQAFDKVWFVGVNDGAWQTLADPAKAFVDGPKVATKVLPAK